MLHTNSEMPTIADCFEAIKFPLYNCPDFSIQGELFPGNRLHVHAKWDGNHMTPSLYKKALQAILTIRKAASQQGIDTIYTIVPEKLIKWEEMLGFRLAEEWTNLNDPENNLFLMKQAT